MPEESDADREPDSEAWKPEGWEDWSHERRTLWRREQQLLRMGQLPAESDEDRERLDPLKNHLRDEIADLRSRLA